MNKVELHSFCVKSACPQLSPSSALIYVYQAQYSRRAVNSKCQSVTAVYILSILLSQLHRLTAHQPVLLDLDLLLIVIFNQTAQQKYRLLLPIHSFFMTFTYLDDLDHNLLLSSAFALNTKSTFQYFPSS